MLGAADAPHLAAGGMRLGCDGQQRSGERAQRTARRCGRLAALVGGPAPALTRRAAFVVALWTRSLATLRRFCRWPKMLRIVGLPVTMTLRMVPRREGVGLRMVGVSPILTLRLVMAPLLPAGRGLGCPHLPSSAAEVSTSTRRRSSS